MSQQIKIAWSWEDVQSLRKDWPKAKCLDALHSVGRCLKERSIEEGWTILGDLLDMHEDCD